MAVNEENIGWRVCSSYSRIVLEAKECLSKMIKDKDKNATHSPYDVPEPVGSPAVPPAMAG